MKKTAIALGVILTSLSVSPVQAADAKSLVIIDSYFKASSISGAVSTVCASLDGCANVAKPSSKFSDAYNHGTAMAEIARKQNPSLPITLVQASDVSKFGVISNISGNTLLKALKWVEANKATVGAVSFSYNLSGNMTKPGECKLSTSGLTNVAIVDPQIRQSIANLKASGILFFAATGNDSNRKPVNYPACITDTVSVAAGVGGAKIPSSNNDLNTDVVSSLPASKFSYSSSLFGLVPQTTSSATASIAANFALFTGQKVQYVLN